MHLTDSAETFEGAGQKPERFAVHYHRVAEWFGCAFLDAGQITVPSELDGIHREAAEHASLGLAVAAKVREALE